MSKVDSLGLTVLRRALRVRCGQLLVNEICKSGAFRVPIHLALGHEAIAIAVDMAMNDCDQLVLSHRNIHYNLARANALKPEVDEYLLKADGLGHGQLGSMNLTNEANGIVYASSILGNNLSVATGYALAKNIRREDGIVIVVTGDGAMEEGAFYEALLFLQTSHLPAFVIVENNQWSLATRIEERRCPIDIRQFASSLGVHYTHLAGNDASTYIERLEVLRALSLQESRPVCIEVDLTTLGSWIQTSAAAPGGKFINYHAGASPSVTADDIPYLVRSAADPIYVMAEPFGEAETTGMAVQIMAELRRDIA